MKMDQASPLYITMVTGLVPHYLDTWRLFADGDLKLDSGKA